MSRDFHTPTERRLAAIWVDVLHLDPVGRAQNFFEIGGDSLLATKVVMRARRDWDIEFNVQTLVDRPVLADLAERIDQLVADSQPA